MTDFFDLSQAEFDALYAEFVADGGLDATKSMNEDFERVYRSQVICKHARPKRDCTICFVPPPKYFPDNGS